MAISNPKLHQDFVAYTPIKVTQVDDIIESFIAKIGVKISVPKAYGSAKTVASEVRVILYKYKEDFLKYKTTEHDVVVLDHAGIGDVVHSRLVVQHIKGNILWIMPERYISLYKDDKVATVVGSCYVRFRNPWCKFCKSMVNVINQIFTSIMDDKKLINIPYNITNYLATKKIISFDKTWFESNSIIRDESKQLELEHHGVLENLNLDLVKSKYLVIEHCSLSFGCLDAKKYEGLVAKLKTIGYKCAYVGAPNDPTIKGAVDCRGYSLYDTFTLIKNSAGFLGRASGNECLVFFDKKIPVFEIGLDKPQFTSVKNYTENQDKRLRSLTEKEFEKSIFDHYKKDHKKGDIMADTLGGLIDKLLTVDLKMWNNQELLYKIRKMTFDEYKKEYFDDEEGAEKLWKYLQKACDLNVQRNQFIDEIDEKVVEIVQSAVSGEELDSGKFIQRKHKTY